MQTIVLLENRYRLIDPVGKGGFATVYKAEDLRNKTIVAVKEITLRDLKPQEIIDATDTYHREIRFGESLKHPALPRVYAHFMDQDHWYIVAQFIDGQTLEEYRQQLPGGQLPLDEVLSIALRVCDVLTYLHSRQPPIIFRDIKPDNIMRTRTGRIYLIDLGIARQFRPGQRRDTQALGSPGYAAPEQYGSDQTTERSDIYSLGATLRALLTGQDPLDEDTTITRKPVALPEELSELLAEMLARDPAQRPTSIISVQRRLERINARVTSSQAAPIPVPPPAPASTPYYIPSTVAGAGKAPATPKKRSGRLKVIAIAIVLLAVLGFGSDNLLNYISGWTHQSSLAQEPSIAPASQQMLNIAVTSNLDEPLDPATVQRKQSMQIVGMTSAGLLSLNDNMEVVSQLADSWEAGDQGYTWTFHLRHNLKFSDGTPLTSADVAYSLDRALDPAQKYGTASYNLQYIKGADQRSAGKIKSLIGQGILVPDADTIIFKLSKNVGYFLQTLTTTCAVVVEKALVDKYGPKFTNHLSEGGSSGPFELVQNTAQKIVLKPNPHYYDHKPALTTIVFTPYESTQNAYSAYQANLSDFVDNIPSSLIDKVNQDQGFHRSLQLTTTYIAMNYLNKPFDNIKIRQAFALAVNKTLISKEIRKNTVLPTNHIIPEGDPGASATLAGPAGVQTLFGDPTLAKKLLAEGMREEGIASLQTFPQVTLTYPSTADPLRHNEMVIMQKMWKNNLGISVQLQEMPGSDFYQAISSQQGVKNMQMWRLSWAADYPDASDWMTVQFGQNASQNVFAYGQNHNSNMARQREIQHILAQADVTQNLPQRTIMYRSVEQELVNDVAWLPLYQYFDNYVVKPNIHGLTINAMGMVAPDDWPDIYVTQ
ncbi:ABC transporter substrate-binding protein [Dictyobacter aurantiacus]|uniref:Protein kinase domain-containing protein n=1 Tax=Dictyobacter aurantiacus TaxID=1936993 RepID=A0A401ZQ47_9CHLR|nr:ABC transporter substrate-binding protein [Dictyobacter aurantiacus]GCE08997.1 hypothetical protein KDAU_63260 [Dictyobacter aurantiacus]